MSEASEKRARRDDDILRLFIAGATYRQIAKALDTGLATVSRTVVKKLAEGQKRRDLLSEEALSVHTERTERLFQAHWSTAIDPKQPGAHRSAEICRKILATQARIREADMTLPAPTERLSGDEDDDSGQDDGPQDDLSRLRAQRGTG